MARNVLNLIGCGGTGSKFVESFLARKNPTGSGIADVKVKMLDSAKSDRLLSSENYSEENTWNFKGMDGSGAFRAENAEAFMAEMPAIMRWIGVEEQNVVVTSASGGTGSVLSVLVTQELLRQGKQVVVIVIGSREDKQACVNTRNTLFSFENVVEETQTPVIMHYLDNHMLGGEQKTNEMATAALLMLSVLFSGENQRLDTKDMANWLNYKTTSCAPKLCMLHIENGLLKPSRDVEYISVSTLTTDHHGKDIGIIPEFSRTGYLSKEAEENIKMPFPVHFAIQDGGFVPIIEELNDMIDEFEKNKVVRSDRSLSSLNKTDVAVVAKKGALIL